MILVETFRGQDVAHQSVEIVERKGKGHVDYICDAVMEAISVALSKEYLKQFGAILHHNIVWRLRTENIRFVKQS